MHKKILFLVFICLFPSLSWGQMKAPAFGEQLSYGKLTIYSDVSGADIYVDAKFVGQDRATISHIPVGKHYVRVSKDEKTVQSGLVEVKEGEETIIVAKPDEELLARMRRPNYLILFGAVTSVGYALAQPAWDISSLPYNPQMGIGMEVKYAIPVIDTDVDLGFLLNYPSTLRFPVSSESDPKGYVWKEGLVSLSSPYVYFTKELTRLGPFRLGIGGGFNYALYTPGANVWLSIQPRLGYAAFLELTRFLPEMQKLFFRAGYTNYVGRTEGIVEGKLMANDITSAGYFIKLGLAYQL